MQLVLRPLGAGDRESLVRILEQLSLDSRVNRFFAPIGGYSEATLAHLVDVDQRDHYALLALVEEDGATTPVADARYVRSRSDGGAAEVGIAVADRFQRRRIGTALLCALAAAARRNGVERFVGQLRSDNAAMRRLLDGLGARIAPDEPGLLRFELSLAGLDEETTFREGWRWTTNVRGASRSGGTRPGMRTTCGRSSTTTPTTCRWRRRSSRR